MERTIKSTRALKLVAGTMTLIAMGAVSPSSAAARSMQCAPASKATIEAQFKRFNDSWQTHDPKRSQLSFPLTPYF